MNHPLCQCGLNGRRPKQTDEKANQYMKKVMSFCSLARRILTICVAIYSMNFCIVWNVECSSLNAHLTAPAALHVNSDCHVKMKCDIDVGFLWTQSQIYVSLIIVSLAFPASNFVRCNKRWRTNLISNVQTIEQILAIFHTDLMSFAAQWRQPEAPKLSTKRFICAQLKLPLHKLA